jgi:hypothetical protein
MIGRLHAFVAAFAACTLLLSAGAASASDGEILINQAKVNAGGIAPGDTAGFPATLSRPGRYKLTSNLKPPSRTTAIEVTANNVNIDLNGFTISSDDSSENHGVDAQGAVGLKVTNGTITGFNSAINNFGGAFAVIENMRLITNQTGFIGGNDAQIRDNTMVSNPSYGVRCGSRCVIERNVITGNYVTEGILISGGGAIVLGNVLAANQGPGIGVTVLDKSGYGQNILVDNNSGGAQVSGPAFQAHPNFCDPACP